ncbi:DinB family protein [Eubacteriales bacterium OttesenSCG-928-A19]|nr:DinB family protein [Eubacteriales bacterium OttesenSCG-928-A19]
MKYFGNGLSELHKELNAIIRKPEKLDEAKQLFLELHSKLHLSAVSGSVQNEVDTLLGDLAPQEYRMMPTAKDETIAWVLWHIARIEDMTMNILVADGVQLFDDEWKKQLNAPISDTGNALSDDEIMDLSRQLNIEKLISYRNTVGARTRDIVKALSANDLKRKVSAKGLEAIKQVGGVTEQEDSLWLLDFWGKKDVAGLLLMPPTRHVMMHLNDCCKWKQHIRESKKCFCQL